MELVGRAFCFLRNGKVLNWCWEGAEFLCQCPGVSLQKQGILTELQIDSV